MVIEIDFNCLIAIKIDSIHPMVIEIDFGHLETYLGLKIVIKICIVAIKSN
jgi:hypothetical protein